MKINKFKRWLEAMKALKSFIPVNKCEHGWLYYVDCRNSYIGIFNKHRDNGFIIIRNKFGKDFLSAEYHCDTGGDFGTAKPLKKLIKFPDEIPEGHLEYTPCELNEKIFKFIKRKMSNASYKRFEKILFETAEKDKNGSSDKST